MSVEDVANSSERYTVRTRANRRFDEAVHHSNKLTAEVLEDAPTGLVAPAPIRTGRRLLRRVSASLPYLVPTVSVKPKRP